MRGDMDGVSLFLNLLCFWFGGVMIDLITGRIWKHRNHYSPKTGFKRKRLVREEGVEPSAHGLKDRCSTTELLPHPVGKHILPIHSPRSTVC